MILERDFNFSMDIYDLFYSPDKVYEGKNYDLVTTTEVVEHLKNPLAYFLLFKELLNEKGVLSIMTLFHPRDDAQFMEWYYIRDVSHISFYTPMTMKVIGEKVGLKMIYTDEKRYVSFRKGDIIKYENIYSH